MFVSFIQFSFDLYLVEVDAGWTGLRWRKMKVIVLSVVMEYHHTTRDIIHEELIHLFVSFNSGFIGSKRSAFR